MLPFNIHIQLTDEQKLFVRLLFALLIIYVQIIMKKKLLRYLFSNIQGTYSYNTSLNTDEKNTDDLIQKKLMNTGDDSIQTKCTVRSRSIMIGEITDDVTALNLDETKFGGKLFMLKKIQARMNKIKQTSFGYHEDKYHHFWLLMKLRQFQAAVTKAFPALVNFSIGERLQILAFQITKFLKRLYREHREFLTIGSLIIIGFIIWKQYCYHYFFEDQTSYKLFSMDALGGRVQPGDLLEVMNVSHSQRQIIVNGAVQPALESIHVRIVRNYGC